MRRTVLAVSLFAGALVATDALSPRVARSGPADEPAATPALAFRTPEEAARSFLAAIEVGDETRLAAILGSAAADLVQDGRDAAVVLSRRALAAAGRTRLDFDRAKEAEGRLVILIGEQAHPLSIPLRRTASGWSFDAEAGRARLLARRVGRNELAALTLARLFVAAQVAYADKDHDGDGVLEYATRLVSTPGRHDGLYWDDDPAEDSPLAVRLTPLVDAAGGAPAVEHALAGYAWRILTAQGPHAPGGARSYLVDGNLVDGFALVAVPTCWRRTAVVTLLVGPDGEVRQKDLGERSIEIANALTTYDPDETWERVLEVGDDDPEDGPARLAQIPSADGRR